VLILCSNGLSSEKLLHETMRVANGCKSAALVVTADNEYKQNNYHVKRCISELNSLGLTVDIFDIDIQNPELLLNYDVIEFIGGNPYYLLNSIRKSNALPILKTIAENKILIGDLQSDKFFQICRRIALRAIGGVLQDKTCGATHYHLRSLRPKWSIGKIPCTEIGNHIFYNDIE